MKGRSRLLPVGRNATDGRRSATQQLLPHCVPEKCSGMPREHHWQYRKEEATQAPMVGERISELQ